MLFQISLSLGQTSSSRLGSKRNIVVPVKLPIIAMGNDHRNQLFRAGAANNVSKLKAHR